MTPEDQAIVDAIWGEEASDINREVLDGFFAMADLIAQRAQAGKTVVFDNSDTLH